MTWGLTAMTSGTSINFQGTLGLKVDLGHDWLLQLDGTAGRDQDFVYDPPNSLVNGNLAAAPWRAVIRPPL